MTSMSATSLSDTTRVAVIGLGYVGLPLAVVLARSFETVGFDIDQTRIDELAEGYDRTDEVAQDTLRASTLKLSSDVEDVKGADFLIVTVPTPVDDQNQPDLRPLDSACALLGPVLTPGSIVVFESTVYPGVTEDICGPALERSSGLRAGRDFFLGYSPERINPGDREHTVDRIQKVIAGQTEEVIEKLAALYGTVTSGGVFRAKSIQAAEAAKVIENAQRDINIAFINEIAMIFQKLGLSTYDVLEAAGTKWNFLKFSPGLVGGHCIGVDPFYLAHRARELGHDPEIILSGRRTNDGMGTFIANQIADLLAPGASALVLGLTFKENVPDLRNTKVVDLIAGLKDRGMEVDVHDAQADAEEARQHFGLSIISRIADLEAGRKTYDCVVGAVPHDPYVALTGQQLAALLKEGGLLADIKGMWRTHELPAGIRRWQL